MNIVLDANIIISALLGSQKVIWLLTLQKDNFYAPRKIVDEIRKYKLEICEKSNQTDDEFERWLYDQSPVGLAMRMPSGSVYRKGFGGMQEWQLKDNGDIKLYHRFIL
mgnify:CR=1 FL=1